MYFDLNFEEILIKTNRLYEEIILSLEFQRLKTISFLGFIKIDPKKGKFNTRYAHSLGVAYLSLKLAEQFNFSEEDKTYLIILCLLHDLGHMPFSHLSEKALNMDHLDQTKKMITKGLSYSNLNENSKSNNTIPSILKRNNIDQKRIIEYLDPTSNNKPLFYRLLHFPFNLDTLDAINRSAFLLNEKFIEPVDLISHFKIEKDNIRLYRKNLGLFDGFWRLKRMIYSKYIFNDNNLKKEAFFTYLLKKLKDMEPESIERLREFSDSQILENFHTINDNEWNLLFKKFSSDDTIQELNIIKVENNINQRLIEQNLNAITERIKKRFPFFVIYDIRLIKTYMVQQTIDDYLENDILEMYNRRYTIKKGLKIIGELKSVENKQLSLKSDNDKITGKTISIPAVECTKEITEFISTELNLQ